MLDNTLNQPPKFKTRNWVEVNDELCGTYRIDNQIKFKTSMLKSSLCHYRDAYILFKGNITVSNTSAAGVTANDRNAKITLKSCAPLTDCVNEINNIEIDHAKDIDVVMSMYHLR